MRKDKIYFGFLIFAVLLYAAVEILKPKPIDWSNDFTRSTSIPYGTEILYNELPVLFPESEIAFNSRTIYDSDTTDQQNKNRIFINDSFGFDRLETEVLLKQVSNGDDVFLSGVIEGWLADTLNLEYDFYFSFIDSVADAGSQTASFKNPELNPDSSWKHSTRTYFHYFISYDSSRTEELGFWNQDQVNYIKIRYGEGNFYLNSTPHLFSNYYLRNPEFAPYAFTALSYLPVRETVWDTYYKSGRKVAGTPMAVVLSTDGLKHAWYLALVTLLLFMIFKAKREQRIIPVIEPPKNSSIQFAQTIGELFLEQGSHKSILEKKITFFYEYISSHLKLDTTTIDEKFKRDLAFRSGIDQKEIIRLFDLIELTEQAEKISAKQLKLITDQIDQFYKNTER